MKISFERIKIIWTAKRIIVYSLLLVVSMIMSFLGYKNIQQQQKLEQNYQAQAQRSEELLAATNQYQDMLELFAETKKQYPEIDLTAEDAASLELWDLLRAGELENAKKKYIEIITAYNIKVAVEEKKKELNGLLTYQSQGIAQTDIQIIRDGQAVKTIKTGEDGSYRTMLAPGKYNIKVTLSGYNEYNGEIEVPADKAATLNIELTKPVAVVTRPKAAASTTTTASDGLYSKPTISTERGSFSVHLLTVDLSTYKMVADTAADGDCDNNCPVLSLEEYVARNAGVAGIHGTYFCPTSYADCAGKTNSFYFKIFNGRLGNKINWSNGLGDYLPFLRISSGGSASYHDTWSEAKDSDMATGLSCRPHLVENSEIVLTDADMDSEKERTYKMSHGFIGLKGQTIYAGVVLNANLYDSAAVSKALGLENSFNLDGGGTTALFSNGAYKAGPGRAMPNAIVFKRR